MNRKGNCWDNAPMGRFFLMERVWRRDYANQLGSRLCGNDSVSCDKWFFVTHEPLCVSVTGN